MLPLNPKWIVIGLIVLYTRPLWILRYQFRSLVYREKSWKINFRPWFWLEIKALFSNRYFRSKAERSIAKRYRLYLIGFFLLWMLFRYLS
jgi:hypothetical protein